LPNTQADRPFRVKTPLGDDVLLLDNFKGDEAVSQPFRFVLKLLSDNPAVDLAGMLKKPVVLTIKTSDDTERHFHGNINRFTQLEYQEDGMVAYEAEVVPWFWFLSLFSDCRIFQNMTAQDIIEQVFSDRGFSDYRFDVQATLPTREYCVQYRETDLNFVSRLLEEEGIFYFFEHTVDKHTLVMADSKTSFDSCPKQASARYSPVSGAVFEDDVVVTLLCQQRVQTGTVSINDYNFEQPSLSLLSSSAGARSGEIYDYPGKHGAKDDGDRYARIRLEEQEVPVQTVAGGSNCRGFQTGYKFTLTDHYRDDANQDYTILSLHHEGQNTGYLANSGDEFSYSNRFEAIPASVDYRPPRLSQKPVVKGSQTALVVGKSGEEIWVDNYGRVKVQFYWDREGVDDENSSCWIRVAQTWAGKQWGGVQIPRIGQEVVVDFLEGDPDRPIIIGSVYNADQMPPYTLPDDQTKTALKSMSSKGGGGFNEIRFEDNAGSEQIFIHAEKDMDVRVKNDRKEWIGEDRHLVVTRNKLEKITGDSHSEVVGNQISKVGGDRHLAVAGKEAIKITGQHSLTVNGDVVEVFQGNHSSQVTQNIYLKGAQVVIEAQAGLTISVGGNFITIDSSGVTIFGTMVNINSGGSPLSGSAGSADSPNDPTAPADADDASPGGTTSVTPGEAATPASMSLDTISPTNPV
jgi:type VI secretion system secreted protein VgrG